MSVLDKIKGAIGIEDEYYDDDYYNDEPQNTSSNANEKEVRSSESLSNTSRYYEDRVKPNNVVNIANPSQGKIKISVHEPLTYDDGPKILDDIMAYKIVVMNLEMLEMDKKRQIFDFVGGGIYSLSGKIQKVTKDIFIIVPKGVEIDGKLKDQIQTKGLYQL